jgi:hypothetical protein
MNVSAFGFPVLVASLSFTVPQLLLMGVILAVATGAASIAKRWARPRIPRMHRPRKLFYTLCKAHQLDHSEQRLLSLIAKAVGLANPSEVFLRSDLLSSDQLGAQFQPYSQQLARLQTRLFGQTSPSKSS